MMKRLNVFDMCLGAYERAISLRQTGKFFVLCVNQTVGISFNITQILVSSGGRNFIIVIASIGNKTINM